MDSVKMQWVECPLLDDDGGVLHPPSCSDDEDDDDLVDLLNRREGHCATVLTFPIDGDAQSSSWIVVCGGYTKGIVSAVPLVSRASLLPALQWKALRAVVEFECDGASLTTTAAEEVCVTKLQNGAAVQGASTAYLFGGFDSYTNLRNTVYAVTLCGEGSKDGVWAPTSVNVKEMNTTGDVPAPRARHGAGGRDGRLFIFGGETATQEQTNDLFVCDARTGVWRALDVSPARPTARLLSVSLVFVSPTTFILYGGSHFVEGVVQSFNDAWRFDVDTETWTLVVDEAENERNVLPCSNGHAGAAVVLPLPSAITKSVLHCTCAVFLGGKDISEGDDRVKMIWISPDQGRAEISARVALPAIDTGNFPHWRYTPAVVSTQKGLLLLAGQCRHPQVPSSFLLSFE